MNPFNARLDVRYPAFENAWIEYRDTDSDGTERTAFDCGWTAAIEYMASLEDCGEPNLKQLELFNGG